jgi:hypothetical protein
VTSKCMSLYNINIAVADEMIKSKFTDYRTINET